MPPPTTRWTSSPPTIWFSVSSPTRSKTQFRPATPPDKIGVATYDSSGDRMSWPPQLPSRYLMWPRPERALVGKGSFGEVWRAKDEHQGGLVALKILRARDARVQTRMEREA